MGDKKEITIDITSDVVCPWCFLGKRRLEQSIAQAQQSNPNLVFKTTWHPFQLDPSTPESGIDRRTYLANKLGGTARVDQIHAHLGKLGKASGIDFEFEGTVLANTLRAHRLAAYALEQGGEKAQNAVVEKLFSGFHEKAQNLADFGVLGDAAEAGGLDREKAVEYLKSDKGVKEVKAQIQAAQRKNIHGVPHFVVNNKYQLSGAQDPETFVQVFSQL